MVKKLFFFTLMFGFVTMSGMAATGMDGFGSTQKTVAIQGIGKTPISIGFGFDFSASYKAFNFGFPIELRLNDVYDRFTFRIGERFSFHDGGDDSAIYYDPYFLTDMWQPTVGFTQFSTYAAVRWNFLHFDDEWDAVLFAGLGYYFNVNTRGRVDLDIPSISYISGTEVYDWGSGRDFKRYRFDDIINPISHTLRVELGVECAYFELSMFLDIDITKPYNFANASQDVYYDVHAVDPNIHYDAMPGFLSANFASFKNIRSAMDDVCYFGMALKFFLWGKN